MIDSTGVMPLPATTATAVRGCASGRGRAEKRPAGVITCS